MPTDLDRQSLFPISDLIAKADFPLAAYIPADLLDTIFDGIYYTQAEAAIAGENLLLAVTLAFEGEIALKCPGVDEVSLVIASGGVGWTSVRGRLTLGPDASLILEDVPIALRFSETILKDAATGGPAELETTFTFEASVANGLRFEPSGTLTLPKCEISDTGLKVSATELAWNFEPGGTVPEAVANSLEGEFLGMAFREAELELPSDISGAPQLQFESCCIGTGGFTGAINTSFGDPPAVAVSGIELALKRIALGFRATNLDMVEVDGRVTISTEDGDSFLAKILPPGSLDAPIDIGVGWSRSRGFYVQAGTPNLELAIPLHLTLGPIELDTLHIALRVKDGEANVDVGLSANAEFGPIAASVDRVGVTAVVAFHAGNLGPIDIGARFKPPNGLGIVVDASVVVGGGYLFFDFEKEQYAGVLQLEIQNTISLKAVGLLTTRMPDGSKGFSLLLIITAEFPPIQLGFGITLNGLGGLLGINRTVVIPVLQAGVKTGTLNSIMFPDDPVKNATRIISDLQSVFPPAQDRYVFGPMAKLGWGSPTLISIELGIALELPSPIRLLIMGRLKLALPTEEAGILLLHMDVLGAIDFGECTASIDASLYDSRIVMFTLSGDAAMRLNWGAHPAFALSAGGFNPRFQPPAGFPSLERLAISLATGDNPRIRLESYFAITTSTAQTGARLEVYAALDIDLIGEISVCAYLGFDALVEFSPFHFEIQVGGGVAIKLNGDPLLSATVELTLAGPDPWHAFGRATFDCFGERHISFDVTRGDPVPQPLPPPPDVGALLRAAFSDVRNWSAQLPGGGHMLVTLRQVEAPDQVLVHPLGNVAVRQRIAPLELNIKRYGSARLPAPASFAITGVWFNDTPASLGDELRDSFAPGQFLELRQEEMLSRPAYEDFLSGRTGVAGTQAVWGTTVEQAFGYETVIIDEPEPLVSVEGSVTRLSRRLTEKYADPECVVGALAETGAAGRSPMSATGGARFAGPPVGVGVRRMDYVVAGAGDMSPQTSFSTYAQADQARRASGDPDLQVVPGHEVKHG